MDSLILNLFVCLIVPLAMSLFVLEGKSRELFVFFLSGIFMCLFAGQINGLIASVTGYDSYMLTTAVTPVVEEILKIIPVIILAVILRADRQTIVECGLMVGLGFATMENMYVLTNSADTVSFFWAASRGFGAAMVHATASLIVSCGISYSKVRKKTFVIGTYAMLLCTMVFHGIYNMLVQSEKLMYFGFLLPTVIFVPLAAAIFRQRKVTPK